MSYNEARVRRLNQARTASGAEYVLYWMQAARRLERNHALDHALACARELARPLVVFEALRIDYPWASRRLHRFVLEGMRDNAARAAATGFDYWPFVETRTGQGRGLLRRLAGRACLVVTDDFPCFVVPAQSEALARAACVPVVAVDSNGLVPLARLSARAAQVVGCVVNAPLPADTVPCPPVRSPAQVAEALLCVAMKTASEKRRGPGTILAGDPLPRPLVTFVPRLRCLDFAP